MQYPFPVKPDQAAGNRQPRRRLPSKTNANAKTLSDDYQIDQLLRWVIHEDDILASRVSFFLLAQSILIAVTASLINTMTSLSHRSESSLRWEVLGLASAITVAGIALTIIFWYVFWLNFLSLGSYQDELTAIMNHQDSANFRSRIHSTRLERRNANWFYRILFRRKGMNWMVTNGLPGIILLLWSALAIFGIIISISN
jgi:hypothetical protein